MGIDPGWGTEIVNRHVCGIGKYGTSEQLNCEVLSRHGDVDKEVDIKKAASFQ
jgi:hypothetical protein